MKTLLPKLLFILVCLAFSGFISSPQDEVEFVCMKSQRATNTCYYNFKIGGIPYHFTDLGCKKKKDAVLKDANEGNLALSKDWKIPCPEVKKEEKKEGL